MSIFGSVHRTLPGIGLVCTLKVIDLVPKKVKEFVFEITRIGFFNNFKMWVVNS